MRDRRVDTIFVVGEKNRLLGYLDIEDINQGLRNNKELIDMMQRDIYVYITLHHVDKFFIVS